jgi:hypothetical protein
MQPRRKFLSHVGLGLSVALIILIGLPVFSQTTNPAPDDHQKPDIAITSVPSDPPGEQMASDPIKGTVSGVDPTAFKVVVYSYGDKWYVQPTAASPRTDINDDKTWQTETHGGTQFAALLVKPSFEPAATLGTLPDVGGDVVAIAKKSPEKK